jgi:hypothetical protein
MYDAEQRMKEIMDAPQLSAVEKSKLYSDQLNRFLTFKNKMDVPAQAPVQRTSLVSPTPVSAEIPPQVPPTLVPAEIPSPVPATPKPNFLSPPPTEGEPRLAFFLQKRPVRFCCTRNSSILILLLRYFAFT